jgi:hypothetical protein
MQRTSLTLGGYPYDLAFDEVTHTAFVATNGRYEGETGGVEGVYPIKFDASMDPPFVVGDPIAMPGTLYGIAINSSGHTGYVYSSTSRILLFDTQTLMATGEVAIPGGSLDSFCDKLVFDKKRSLVYGCNSATNVVHVMDVLNMRYVKAISLGDPADTLISPQAMAISERLDCLYVGSRWGRGVTIIDLDTQEPIGILQAENGDDPQNNQVVAMVVGGRRLDYDPENGLREQLSVLLTDIDRDHSEVRVFRVGRHSSEPWRTTIIQDMQTVGIDKYLRTDLTYVAGWIRGNVYIMLDNLPVEKITLGHDIDGIGVDQLNGDLYVLGKSLREVAIFRRD